MRKFLSFCAVLAAAVCISAVPAFSVFNAPDIPDADGDGRADAFDLVTARRGEYSEEELQYICDFLLGIDAVKPERPTGSPTEAATEPLTESLTDAPAEPITESPTEAQTEAPTEPMTESPTEAQTEAPTEPMTESPTNPPTEPPTEPPQPDIVIDESCILEPKGTVHTGDGTFYGGGYVGGCAMLDPVSTDYWIVAMNLADYNNAQLAGAYIEVTGELGTINMLVTDLLPEGKKGDLDLYVDAFPLIAPPEKGRVPVSWRIIPLDSAENAPVCYKYKEGTTQYWCGIQVRNHRYPITRLEYLDKNGEFKEIPRRNYNYFESMDLGAGPFTFRLTDIYGQVIIDENIPLSTDDTEIIPGHVQFPK